MSDQFELHESWKKKKIVLKKVDLKVVWSIFGTGIRTLITRD